MPDATPQNREPLQNIVICGASLAGVMCAAALSKHLPKTITITLINTAGADTADIFYGTVTTPMIYEFLLDIDLSEPDLLPNTNTSFSLGTQYKNWGSDDREWMQIFHRPLPLFQGVYFHHYLTRLSDTAAKFSALETYIMSAHAARKGVFAHPPEDRKTPLSDVKYGYHFLPSQWRDLIFQSLAARHVEIVKADIVSVQAQTGQIQSLTLSDKQTLTADFVIDCLGPDSILASQDKKPSRNGRALKAVSSFTRQATSNRVCRELNGLEYGWHAKTPLQDGTHHLLVYDPSAQPLQIEQQTDGYQAPVLATVGFLEAPWENNCLTLGLGAAILEPLSPAPMTLLQHDIERLIELIPVSGDMTVERREYNRRFSADYEHGSDFQRGFFGPKKDQDTPYWGAAKAEPISKKLAAKIAQFQSRGSHVQYDLEPFQKEDWTQQHFGMGISPQRYDRLADKMTETQLLQTLKNMKNAYEAMANKLPPHDHYMKNLLQYLRKQHG